MDSESIGDDAELRAALNELERILIREHRQRVEELRETIPHNITFVELEGDFPGSSGAPCAPYALGLASDPDYWSVISIVPESTPEPIS